MRTRLAAVGLIVAACLGMLHHGIEPPRRTVDQVMYLRTVHEMRDGAGYYTAMDHSMESVTGPSASTRAYRTPTVFWGWAALPSDRAIWLGWLIVAGLCGLLTMAMCQTALAGPLVTALLLLTMQRTSALAPGGDQWTLVEAWSLPVVLGATVLLQRGRQGWAAGLATAAVLIRETTAGLLFGGLFVALAARRGRRPWILGLGVAVAFGVYHFLSVRSHLVDGRGNEASLVLVGHPRQVLDMIGYGIPGGWPVGLVLWIAGVWWMEHRGWSFARAYLALPLIGLLVTRGYWGVLVLPFTVGWGIDGIRAMVVGASQRLHGRVRPAHPVLAASPS